MGLWANNLVAVALPGVNFQVGRHVFIALFCHVRTVVLLLLLVVVEMGGEGGVQSSYHFRQTQNTLQP